MNTVKYIGTINFTNNLFISPTFTYDGTLKDINILSVELDNKEKEQKIIKETIKRKLYTKINIICYILTNIINNIYYLYYWFD